MSYQRRREEWLVWAVGQGCNPDTARRILRLANTRQRLAVAQCNGDYPADNGERRVKPCDRCESLWAPSVLTRYRKASPHCSAGTCLPADPCVHPPARGAWGLQCPDCRATDRAAALIRGAREGWRLQAQGDPRGECTQVEYGDTDARDIRRTMPVPTRNY